MRKYSRLGSSSMDIDALLGDSRPASLPTKSAIYVWGYNQCGQTGRNGKECQLRIPKQLPPELFGCPAGQNSRWLDIACGREHTAAVASDGSLFAWGYDPSLSLTFLLCARFWEIVIYVLVIFKRSVISWVKMNVIKVRGLLCVRKSWC